jgi:hypothetical protein
MLGRSIYRRKLHYRRKLNVCEGATWKFETRGRQRERDPPRSDTKVGIDARIENAAPSEARCMRQNTRLLLLLKIPILRS